MNNRTIAAMVASMVLLAGVAGGWFARGLLRPSVPPEVARACAGFNTAYANAEQLASQANQAFDQWELAHPVRVNEVWKARHQAALEDAATIAMDAAGSRPSDWPWWPIVSALDSAQRALNPGVGFDYSSVDQQTALQGAVLACLGRG